MTEGLDATHALLERFWHDAARVSRLPPQSWRDLFATALAEIVANGLRHAYPPFAVERPLRLRLRLFPDRVEALLVDQGQPYVLIPPCSDQPEDLLEIDTLPEGGYGLRIARAALDSLRYRRTRSGFNCWRLVKRMAVQ